MKRALRFAPSPAMVVSCLALLVALGGVGYAATALPRNSVGTPQLKKNAVTSIKVKDRSLLARDFKAGQLQRGARGLTGAQGAQGAKGDKGDTGPSTGPAGGDLQGSYPNPTIAPGAVTASKLSAEEAWRDVGAAGEPAFAAGWSNYGSSYEGVGFRKDRDGVVHLRGGGSMAVDSGSGSTMFTLPAGYRPDQVDVFVVASTNGSGTLAPSAGIVEVGPNGQLFVYSGSDDRYISLSGISFTATQ